MLMPLLLPSVNISSFLNSTSQHLETPTADPIDVGICNRFYSPDTRPPDLPSCASLFEVLPQGSEPIPFYVNPSTAYERENALPLIVGGRQDWCQIQFHLSGPAVDERMNPVMIDPRDIRHMFTWVFWQCVRAIASGGMVTKRLSNSVNWLTAGDTVYPGPAPQRTAYYSLHIWDHDGGGNLRWNPGNQDPSVGRAIVNAVNDYAHRLPKNTPLRRKVERVGEYLVGSTSLMGYGSNRNWWQ